MLQLHMRCVAPPGPPPPPQQSLVVDNNDYYYDHDLSVHDVRMALDARVTFNEIEACLKSYGRLVAKHERAHFNPARVLYRVGYSHCTPSGGIVSASSLTVRETMPMVVEPARGTTLYAVRDPHTAQRLLSNYAWGALLHDSPEEARLMRGAAARRCLYVEIELSRYRAWEDRDHY